MSSRDVQLTLMAAYREAKNRRHAFLTLEHMLYALTHNQLGAKVLAQCGVDSEALRQRLETFFEERIEKSPPGGEEAEPMETLAFQRVLHRAVAAVQAAEKEEIDAGDLLASLLLEERSPAAFFIVEQGAYRLDILQCVSHGMENGDVVQKAHRPRKDTEPGGTSEEYPEEETPARKRKTERSKSNLARYCTDLTAWAKEEYVVAFSSLLPMDVGTYSGLTRPEANRKILRFRPHAGDARA